MQALRCMHSETFTWLIDAVVVTVASFVAFSYLGWLCTFLIELFGMTLTMGMELNGDQAIAK